VFFFESVNEAEKARHYLLTHQKAISSRTFEEEHAFKDVINLSEGKDSLILHNQHPRDVTSLVDLILSELGAKFPEIVDDVQEDIKNNALVVNEEFVRQIEVCGDGGAYLPYSIVLSESILLKRRYTALVTFHQSTTFTRQGSNHVNAVIFIAAPTQTKMTKSALETGRTFATLLSNDELRRGIIHAKSTEEIEAILRGYIDEIKEHRTSSKTLLIDHEGDVNRELKRTGKFLGGIRGDLKRRAKYYFSDYKEGVVGKGTISKTISTIFFLYFASLLPVIAFGVLYEENTEGAMDVRKIIISQAFGGVVFALVGGQPLIVLLSTAPLALLTKVIYGISVSNGVEFLPMFAWTGIWNSIFLVILSLSDASSLMRFSTRFLEETFAMFIVVAFSYDSLRPLGEQFATEFWNCTTECHKDQFLLSFILLVATTWISVRLYYFRYSVLLKHTIRGLLADYALFIGVILVTIFAQFVFAPLPLPPFSYREGNPLNLVPLLDAPVWAIFLCAALGLSLSILFYVDQNVSARLTNHPSNKLRKGSSYHWDLFVVAIINLLLSLYGLPWVHAAIPHSPLHAKALADLEKVVVDGHLVERVVKARETRLTLLISHLMIGVSLLMVPIPLQYIPVPVLYGVFLFMAITSLDGNQFYERMKLIFTEQNSYPATSFIRRVKQRVIHLFTLTQFLCLAVLCIVGFFPYDYVELVMPVILLLLMPLRHFLLPKLFARKDLVVLDN
jgi:sodium borate transporter 11